MSMHFKPEDCQLNLQFMTIKPAVTPLTYSLQQIVAEKQTISCLISPAITQKRWLSQASALAILLPGFFFSTLSKGSSPSILSNMWETSKKAVVSSIALYVTHMAPKGRVRVQMGLAIQIRGLRFASNGQFPTPGFGWLIRVPTGDFNNKTLVARSKLRDVQEALSAGELSVVYAIHVSRVQARTFSYNMLQHNELTCRHRLRIHDAAAPINRRGSA